MRIAKSIYSSIKQYRFSALLNVIGLSIGLATAFFALTVLINIFCYNTAIKDYERIFQVESRLFSDEWQAKQPECFTKSITGAIPHVEKQYNFTYGIQLGKFTKEESASAGKLDMDNISGMPCKPEFIDLFEIELLEGSWHDVFDLQGIALSESVAEKYDIKIGDNIFDGRLNSMIPVVAIFADAHPNTSLKALDFIHYAKYDKDDKYITLVKLRSADEKEDFIENVKRIISTSPDETLRDAYGKTADKDFNDYFRLTRIDKINTSVADSYISTSHIPFAVVLTLIFFLLIILSIVFINYYNFFVALIPRRMQRINMQKIMGAQTFVLRMELVLESIALVALALGIAYLIIDSIATSSFTFVHSFVINVSLTYYKGVTFAILAAIGSIVAIITSVYPAWYITSFKPAFVLNGNFATTGFGRTIRNTLLTIQFVISMIFITISMVMLSDIIKQSMQQTGMDTSVLNYRIYVDKDSQSMTPEECKMYREALLSHPDIENVSFLTMPLILQEYIGFTRFDSAGVSFDANGIFADCNMANVFGIKITEGRDFSEDNSADEVLLIINEAFKKQHGADIGDVLLIHGDINARVEGVCNDFKYTTLNRPIEPLAIIYDRNTTYNFAQIKISESADVDDVKEFITAEHRRMKPNEPWEGYTPAVVSYDEYLKKNDIPSIFWLAFHISLITIFISLLGVLGMVRFDSEYRQKEIAIRRVNGATRSSIIRMLNMRYGIMTLIAFLFSAPISCIILNNTINAASIDVYIAGFIFSLLLVSVLTFAIVSLGAWRVVNRNPIVVINKL